MSEAFAVEFETPEGDRLDIGWDSEALTRLDEQAAAGPNTPWLLDGELDWDEVELIRVLSAKFDDGRLLGVAAIRPKGAEGHGDELVVSALVDADGAVEPVSETLLSVEYDGAGKPRRAGLELYRGEGSIPLRAAGDATAIETTGDGSLERTSAALRMRLAGAQGVGRLDIVRPA
jgi:hypothetical protein